VLVFDLKWCGADGENLSEGLPGMEANTIFGAADDDAQNHRY
jgi:hypothetical protein